MTPLKNGAIINFPYSDAALRCDVYKLDGYGWLFRVNNHLMPKVDDPDFTIIDYDRWFDEHNLTSTGTMIVPEYKAVATDKFHEYVAAGAALINDFLKDDK